MKQVLTLLVFLIGTFHGFSQTTKDNRCDCKVIGLDPAWADSNRITCYLIPVERNFTKPRNSTYLLAIATVPGLQTTLKEPLLYLHGGPGIATLSNLPRYLKAKTFSLLRQDHALIFFDYRGTGFSEPSFCKTLNDTLHLLSNLQLPADSSISKTIEAYLTCKEEMKKQDVQLSDFSSLQSAVDAESVRKALRIENWVIYSVSHGTTVALNMMRSFPNHIKSVILDSPYPLNAPWSDFVHPFDTSFKVLEKKLSSDPIYAKIFPSIRKDFIAITSRLKTSPFAISLDRDQTTRNRFYKFNDRDFAWSVWTAMLSPGSIPLVPLALKEIAAGNNSVLLHWALTFNDPNSFGEFTAAQSKAILAYELKPRFEEETEQYLLREFPDFAALINPGMDAALQTAYRSDSAPKEYFEPVTSNIPTLIFSGEYDPVCPPVFATVTASTLANSTVIIVPAASHAAMYADDCTRSIGTKFHLDPYKKIDTECIRKRKNIDFISSDILKHIKK